MHSKVIESMPANISQKEDFLSPENHVNALKQTLSLIVLLVVTTIVKIQIVLKHLIQFTHFYA